MFQLTFTARLRLTISCIIASTFKSADNQFRTV